MSIPMKVVAPAKLQPIKQESPSDDNLQIKSLEEKISLLEQENAELRSRVTFLESQPWTPPKVPQIYSGPNFKGMTQNELGNYAKSNGIDLSGCSRASEVIDRLEKSFR